MAGQGFERREVLRFIGLASVAGTFPGFQRWVFACSRAPTDTLLAQALRHPYEPLFFSADQFRMVDQLSEMIIPANDTPGAKEAGVAEFIDFMVANKVWVTGRDEYQSLGRKEFAARDYSHWRRNPRTIRPRARLAQCA